MKSSLIKTMMALLAVLVFGIVGCGGGGGGDTSSTPAPTPSTTTFSTAKLFPTVATDTTYYTLSGSDNRGGTWTGSWSQKGDGPTTFEGRDVTKLSQQISLSLVGGSSATSYVTGYYNPDRSMYKTIYSGSSTGYAVQTNNFTAPLSFKIGDSTTGPSLTTYLNGTTDYSTSTFQVTDAGGGNAKVTSVVRQTSATSTTEQIITPAGDMISMRMIINYTSGLSVTLTGSK